MSGSCRLDHDAALGSGDGRADRVGGRHRPSAGGLQGDAEGVGARGQGRVSGQDGLGIGAGEVDRAAITGGGVAVGVEGGHGDVVSDPRDVGVRDARDGQDSGCARTDDDVALGPGDACRDGIAGTDRLRSGCLERDAEGVRSGVGHGERVVRGQTRAGIGRGEADRATVSGSDLSIRVCRGYGQAVGHSRHVRARYAGDSKGGGRRRLQREAVVATGSDRDNA